MNLLRALRDLWNGFWFKAIDARDLAVQRVTLALLLLWNHLMLWPELGFLFSDQGPIQPLTISKGRGEPRWSFYDWVGDLADIQAVHLLAAVPMVLLALGFKSRLMCFLALLVQVAVHHRMPWAQHGGDRVLRLMTLYMCLVPTGAMWSLDAWWRRRRGQPPTPTVAAITTRLVRLQVAVIYFFTGVLKAGSGTWLTGWALYYAVGNPNFQRFPAATEWALDTGLGQLATRVGTWTTLGWELAFPLLILWAPARRWALGLGLFFHAGIALTMMVGSFSHSMVWAYPLFLAPGWAARLRDRLRG